MNGALPIILSGKGKILMDKIRTITADLQNQQRNMLSNAVRQSQEFANTITFTIIITTLVAITITGFSIYLINSSIHKRHLAVQRSLQTEVKKRTEQLQNANSKLLTANEQLLATEKAKEEFISMISHELRTPIVPVKGYAQMLLRPKFMGDINDKQKNAINSMPRNIEKLQALVDDVLDVYKLDLGKLKFSRSYINITQLIDQTIAELKPLAFAKQIDLIVDMRTDGPVFCDSDRIEQVLSNLIKNSIDFVPDKGGKITVRVEKDNINNIILTVEDNGIGIKPEKADKLFQKFYQIDTGPTRKHGGTGLGLVICRGLVEAHGGKIWVDTTYKNGAAIKFTLADKEKQEVAE